MGDSICLDSDVLIDLLRNKKETVEWIKEHEEKDVLATTIVNVFELYSGAYKLVDSESKVIGVKRLIEKLKILNFSLNGVEEAGKQNAFLEKKGNIIDKRDLFIGIISLTEGFSIKTNNKKHFERLQGLNVL